MTSRSRRRMWPFWNRRLPFWPLPTRPHPWRSHVEELLQDAARVRLCWAQAARQPPLQSLTPTFSNFNSDGSEGLRSDESPVHVVPLELLDRVGEFLLLRAPAVCKLFAS